MWKRRYAYFRYYQNWKINNNIVINVNGFTGPYATYNKTLTIKLGDYSVDIASGNLEFNNEGFRKAFFGFMANNFASENKNEDYYHNFIKMMEMTIEGLFGKKIKFVEDEKKSDIKNWFNAKKQENEQENEQK